MLGFDHVARTRTAVSTGLGAWPVVARAGRYLPRGITQELTPGVGYRLHRSGRFIPKVLVGGSSVKEVWDEVEVLSGLRTSDEFTLRSLATAYGMNVENTAYVDVPVPRLISRLKANLLFAEPPDIKADQPSDQEQLDDVVGENDLPAEMRGASCARPRARSTAA